MARRDHGSLNQGRDARNGRLQAAGQADGGLQGRQSRRNQNAVLVFQPDNGCGASQERRHGGELAMFSFIDWAQGPLTDLLWSGRSGSGKIYDKFGNFRRQRQFLGEFRPQRDLEQVYATVLARQYPLQS